MPRKELRFCRPRSGASRKSESISNRPTRVPLGL